MISSNNNREDEASEMEKQVSKMFMNIHQKFSRVASLCGCCNTTIPACRIADVMVSLAASHAEAAAQAYSQQAATGAMHQTSFHQDSTHSLKHEWNIRTKGVEYGVQSDDGCLRCQQSQAYLPMPKFLRMCASNYSGTHTHTQLCQKMSKVTDSAPR